MKEEESAKQQDGEMIIISMIMITNMIIIMITNMIINIALTWEEGGGVCQAARWGARGGEGGCVRPAAAMWGMYLVVVEQ